MNMNISTQGFVYTNSSTVSGDTGSVTTTGMRMATEGLSPDLVLLTSSDGKVTGYETGRLVQDMPPELQGKTASELAQLAATPAAAGYSSLPPSFKTNPSYIEAPFSQATGSQTANFTVYTDGTGKVAGVDMPDNGGRLTLDPPLTMAEFSRMVRSEGSPVHSLEGKTFRSMESLATTPSLSNLVSSASTDASISSPPAPKIQVSNPYLAPSTAAQLTSILMDIASLKAQIADKESQAIINTMEFMIRDAITRSDLAKDKADAEKLAAAAKIVAASMSIVGSVISAAGSAKAMGEYESGKKRSGTEVSDATGVKPGADGGAAATQKSADKEAARTEYLHKGTEAAQQRRADDAAVDDGASVRSGLREAHESDTGAVGSRRDTDPDELTLTFGHSTPATGESTPRPGADGATRREVPADGDTFTVSSGRGSTGPDASEGTPTRPGLQRQESDRNLLRGADAGDDTPRTGADTPRAGGDAPDAGKPKRQEGEPDLRAGADGTSAPSTDGAGSKASPEEGRSVLDDYKHMKDSQTEREHRMGLAKMQGDVIAKTGEILSQGMTIASIEQRSTAEQHEILQQAYGELLKMVQQGQVGDQQTINSEFKEVLNLAKELMQKETQQLAELFNMRM